MKHAFSSRWNRNLDIQNSRDTCRRHKITCSDRNNMFRSIFLAFINFLYIILNQEIVAKSRNMNDAACPNVWQTSTWVTWYYLIRITMSLSCIQDLWTCLFYLYNAYELLKYAFGVCKNFQNRTPLLPNQFDATTMLWKLLFLKHAICLWFLRAFV